MFFVENNCSPLETEKGRYNRLNALSFNGFLSEKFYRGIVHYVRTRMVVIFCVVLCLGVHLSTAQLQPALDLASMPQYLLDVQKASNLAKATSCNTSLQKMPAGAVDLTQVSGMVVCLDDGTYTFPYQITMNNTTFKASNPGLVFFFGVNFILKREKHKNYYFIALYRTDLLGVPKCTFYRNYHRRNCRIPKFHELFNSRLHCGEF